MFLNQSGVFKLSVLLVLLQSLMLAERACVYNMLLNLMETREAGNKLHPIQIIL